jgi:uncharacterized phage infection (PIP) family protein YhgE
MSLSGETSLEIPIEDASPHQLLVALYLQNQQIISLFNQMGPGMSQLSDAVAALDTRVNTIADAIRGKLDDAAAKLTAAQDALSQAQANDESDAATIADLRTQLDAALADAQQAVASITTDTDQLGSLVQDSDLPTDGGDVPTDQPPVDQPPADGAPV